MATTNTTTTIDAADLTPEQRAWFENCGQQGTVSFQDHVRLTHTSPSIRGMRNAAEYLELMHRVPVDKSVLVAAVNRGELPALELGRAWMFVPAQLDAWLESRWINRP